MVGKYNIKFLESNYRLKISVFVDDKKINCSQTFYSTLNFDNLIDGLNKFIDNTQGNKIKLVLIDKKGINSKTIYGKIDFSLISKNKILNDLVSTQKKIILLKEQSYRIIIDNCLSSKSDKKSFTIICKDEINNVKTKLECLLEKIKENEIDDNLVFSNQNMRYSHRILVQKSGNNKNYKKKSLGFSILFENYSSSELIDLLISYITKRGGKK